MYLEFESNVLVPEGCAGCARGPVIFIRPEYKNDQGLLEHERTHVRQWLRTFGLHSFLYLLSDDYKYHAELEAYRVQLKYCQDKKASANKFANFICNNYDLNLDLTKVLQELLN